MYDISFFGETGPATGPVNQPSPDEPFNELPLGQTPDTDWLPTAAHDRPAATLDEQRGQFIQSTLPGLAITSESAAGTDQPT